MREQSKIWGGGGEGNDVVQYIFMKFFLKKCLNKTEKKTLPFKKSFFLNNNSKYLGALAQCIIFLA